MVELRVLLSGYSSGRKLRRQRRELTQFADALKLFLACGFDLSYSWEEATCVVKPDEKFSLLPTLKLKSSGMLDHLRALSVDQSLSDFGSWFGVLESSYRIGSPLVPVVRAMNDTLRRDQAREFEEHCRNLPTKTNVLLLLFFLPPALLLIFSPLVWQFQSFGW